MGRISEIIKNRRESTFGFFYLMTVGVLLAWVMVAGIIDTTIFERNHFASLIRMFFIVGIFGLFFLHKYLTRIGIVLLVLVTMFVASGFLFVPDELAEPNISNRFAELISGTAQYITGARQHTLVYERVITWALSLFFGFFVVFFSYRKFRFWLLFVVSVATTSLAITSPFFRDIRIFYTYAFCILALVIKYLHEKNISKMANPPQRATFIKVVVPLVAVVVLIASSIPRPPTLISGGSIRDFFRTPFNFVNDMFLNMTQQREFSLRQIGFGESGGRLGGDIEANDRVFMRINANTVILHPIYLTGATRDTYTGYSWENLHNDYQSVDFDTIEQNLEFVERITSESYNWMQWQSEIVASGNLVQIDADEFFANEAEQGSYWGFDDTENLRIFVDESDFIILVDVDYTPDWYIDIINDEFFYPTDARRGRIEIDNLDRRLTTIFHTGIVRDITASDDAGLSFLRNRDGRLLSEQRLQNNTIYAVYYHTMPSWFYSHNNLEFSRRGVMQEAVELFEIFRQNYGYDLNQMMFTVNGDFISHENLLNYYLIPRADRIYEIYTVLPDDFPERVRELALEVTADAANNFEKMSLLEAFLNENFAYTLTPGSTPIDQDFVDHFLFDLKQGYCVHFATAFVTMARSLGMPTRYVEGFHVNVPATRSGEDIYVFNRMAHAWPEVYFEGYGWHRFEPTPASGLEQQENSASSSGADGAWPNPEDWGIDVPNFNPDWLQSAKGSANSGSQSSGSVADVGFSVWMWIGVVLLFIAIVIFVRVIFVLWRISRMRKKDNNEIVIDRFEVLLSYLKLLGFEIKDTETANQFTTRIRNSFSNLDFEKEMLNSASVVFTKARYSKHDITDIEFSALEKLIQRLDTRMRLQLGKWRYFIYRYILAIL